MASRGLGKGLEALFPQGVQAEALSHQALRGARTGISVNAIDPSPFQPRMEADPLLLEELAASIRKHGILQPILVRPVAGRFQLIAGQRRWLAAKQAGMERIPASVVEVDDQQAATLSLIENLQREDLNPLDLAEGLQRLCHTFHLSQQEVAALLGKSRSEVANTLRLLKAPARVREAIRSGAISKGHARAILSASSAAQQLRLLKAAEAQGLSVRQVEHLARDAKGAARKLPAPPASSAQAARTPTGAETEAVVRALEEALQTRVVLRLGKKGDGQIRIRFHSLEQLEGLLEKLAGSSLNDDLNAG